MYICLSAYRSTLTKLDEECNLHKKFTVTFLKGPRRRQFSKTFTSKRWQTDRYRKKAFGSKCLPFHLLALSDRMCVCVCLFFFHRRFTWKHWELSPSSSRTSKRVSLKNTCLPIGDGWVGGGCLSQLEKTHLNFFFLSRLFEHWDWVEKSLGM